MAFVQEQKESQERDVRPSFVRQRRALLAVGLTLTFYAAAGVRFDELTVLGNTIELTRPELLPVALWVMWAYTMIRYYQLLRDLEDRRPRSARVARLMTIVGRRSAREFANDPPSGLATLDNGEHAAVFADQTEFAESTQSEWVFRHKARTAIGTGVQEAVAWHRHSTSPPTTLDRVRAGVWVAFHTRYFTEYHLPWLIGMCPLLTVVYVHVRQLI